MATFSLTDAQVFAGGYDLRSQANEISIEQTVEERESTTFGSGGVRERKAGLKDYSMSVKGFADPTVTDSLWSAVGSSSDLVVSISPTATAGDAVYIAKGALVGSFSGSEQLGELRQFDATLSGRNPRGIVRSTIIRAHSASTAGGTGTAYLIGATSSTQRVHSAVHLTALSGTATPTLTVTIESDSASGFTSPTTVHTHTALTAVGADWAETAGAITDTYFRITWTLSGTTPSATFIVSLGIA